MDSKSNPAGTVSFVVFSIEIVVFCLSLRLGLKILGALFAQNFKALLSYLITLLLIKPRISQQGRVLSKS